MSCFGQRSHQLFSPMLGITGLGIVHQGDSHAVLP
jgi:hypothetical protein